MATSGDDILAGRSVSTGSVYSTVLIATAIQSAAPSVHAALLVDVGSGESPYRGVIAHGRYVGVDRSPRAPDALLVTADAAALPLATAVADAVLCTEVIEHVPDERALAAELARIAAPGASMLLSAPFVHGLHEQPYDFRRLTSIGLVTTLESAGWTVDSIRPIGGAVVVAVDGAVRWVDSMWRRVVGRIVRRGSSIHRVLTAPSSWVQRRAAAVTLAVGRNLGPIDPWAPTPRLTLGYVVAATRREETAK